MRAARALWGVFRYILADVENCMNSKAERRWLYEIPKTYSEARVQTYAARGGGADKFAGIVVKPGPDAADNRIIADVKELPNGACQVLVLTRDTGLKRALSDLDKPVRFACNTGGVKEWLRWSSRTDIAGRQCAGSTR